MGDTPPLGTEPGFFLVRTPVGSENNKEETNTTFRSPALLHRYIVYYSANIIGASCITSSSRSYDTHSRIHGVALDFWIENRPSFMCIVAAIQCAGMVHSNAENNLFMSEYVLKYFVSLFERLSERAGRCFLLLSRSAIATPSRLIPPSS